MKSKNRPDQSPKVHQEPKLKNKLEIRQFNWTDKQKELIELILSKNTKIVFIKGPAGSSKSLVSVYAGLELLNQHKLSNLMYIRSIVESGDSKIGMLPGTVEDKVYQYGLPLMDKLEELLSKSDISSLINDNKVKTFPVNFIRGQSWNAKFVLLDEAQNNTQKELITLLTRLGQFSKCVVLADPDQSDINGKSGAFESMFNVFNNDEAKERGIFCFEFGEEDILRSELCRYLVKKFKGLTPKKL